MKTSPNAHKPRLNALIVDHDDSFTQNLKWWLAPTFTVQIASAQDFTHSQKNFDLVVLSAGPKSPNDYVNTLSWLKKNPTQPTLGICLGMQMMTVAEGGSVSTYSPVQHGKTSEINFLDSAIKEKFLIARYHSLRCDPPETFSTVALSQDDGLPMWIEHKSNYWMGWQFHPESFLTKDNGFLISYLTKWLQR